MACDYCTSGDISCPVCRPRARPKQVFETVKTLREALRILVEEEHLGDWVYDIKERTYDDASYKGNSWDHPRVKRFSNAVSIIEHYVEYGEEKDA